MNEIIAVINQKGGVGKSTTTLALGAGLTLRGFRVLYLDLDAQGNLSHTMQAPSAAYTTLDLLTGQVAAPDAITQTPLGSIIPASPALAGADAILTETGKEYRLRESLQPIRDRFDYILLDTPPALGVLTINALTACTSAIIPAQADIYSLQGINQLYTTIETVRKYCNPALVVAGILLTRHNPRSVLSRDLTEAIDQTAGRFQTKLFRTAIRETVAIKEAQASQQDIFSYAPKSNAAADYNAFLDELLERS